VARICILRVTRLLAVVDTAVERTITRVGASEHASPFLDDVLTVLSGMLFAAFDFVSTVSAKQGLFDLTAVAASIDTHFASSAETLVARSRALVFSTGHEVTANFTTAPAILVVGVGTSTGRLVLTTETGLCRTHMGTRRARASVTGQLTGMRTFANSFSATGVSAGVWWEASDCTRFDLFLTPTGVCLGQGVLRKVASWTPPLAERRNFAVLSTLLLGSGRPLVLRPLLDTGHVEDGPACVTRPDFRVAKDFARADGAFVVTVVNIMVGTGGNIGSCGFGKSASLRARLCLL
jgi:hypothetical protein